MAIVVILKLRFMLAPPGDENPGVVTAKVIPYGECTVRCIRKVGKSRARRRSIPARRDLECQCGAEHCLPNIERNVTCGAVFTHLRFRRGSCSSIMNSRLIADCDRRLMVDDFA